MNLIKCAHFIAKFHNPILFVATKRMVFDIFCGFSCKWFFCKTFVKKKRPKFWFLRIEEKKRKKKHQ